LGMVFTPGVEGGRPEKLVKENGGENENLWLPKADISQEPRSKKKTWDQGKSGKSKTGLFEKTRAGTASQAFENHKTVPTARWGRGTETNSVAERGVTCIVAVKFACSHQKKKNRGG